MEMDREAVLAFLHAEFPAALSVGELVSVDEACVVLELRSTAAHLRPGGTISGPTLMGSADAAMYIALLSRLGLSARQAVTSSLECHFLGRPRPGLLRTECRLLKVGRRLAVGVVQISAEGERVAHATVTYVMPGSA